MDVFTGERRLNTRIGTGNDMKMWDLNTDDDTPHSYLVVKAGTEYCYKQVRQFCSHSVHHSGLRAAVRKAVSACMRAAIPKTFKMEEFWEDKNMAASLGEPFRAVFASVKDMVEELGMDNVQDYLWAIDEAVKEGCIKAPEDIFTFLVHAKRDKYDLQKLLDGRFRTIQGADFVSLFISYRYFGWASKAMSLDTDECMTSFTEGSFADDLLGNVGYDSYAAVDFSGFDRTEAQNVVQMFIEELGQRGFVPQNVIDFVRDLVSYGDLVMPDGKIVIRWGGNPSGQYLTTVLNSLYHKTIIFLFQDVHQIEFASQCVEMTAFTEATETL